MAHRAKSDVGEQMQRLESAKSEDESSDEDGEDKLLCNYICFMHRGELAKTDKTVWVRAARLHLEAERKTQKYIECGPDSCMKVVDFVQRPDDCAYLDAHGPFVVKKIHRVAEARLHECRTLRALADFVERNSQHFALPLEMWCNEALDEYVTLTPKKPGDLFHFMRAHSRERADGQLHYATVGCIVEQVTRALSILHDEYAIAHNDIKPENVLIDPGTMQCWLCDFGGAVMLERDQTDCFIQTLLYASPERHQKHKCSTSTDIWSLGLMAAELRRARNLDELVDEERWLALLKQPHGAARNEKLLSRRRADEWLDEPGVIGVLCDTNEPLAKPFYALLRCTVRHYPEDRSSAEKLLCNTEVSPLFHGFTVPKQTSMIKMA